MQRRKDFKKGIDHEDARRKREEYMVQLRKAKREEHHAKRRTVRARARRGPAPALQSDHRARARMWSAGRVGRRARGRGAGGRRG